MHRIQLKKIIVIVFLILLVIVPTETLAGNTAGGESSQHGSGSNYEWNYATYGRGVRISLYKYDGSNLTYYGSRDYCASGVGVDPNSCLIGRDAAYQHVEKIGKIAYQQISSYKNSINYWSNQPFKITTNTNTSFSRLFDDGWSDLERDTKNLFSLNSGNKTEILNKIKAEFYPDANQLTTAELGMIYITIEPTLYITGGNKKYYGSAYEFVHYFDGVNINGLNNVIYRDLPESIMAQYISGTPDYLNFVNNNGKFVRLVPSSNLLRPNTENNRKTNTSIIKGVTSDLRDGYGINVFWMGTYVEPTSCTITESANKQTYTLNIFGSTADITYGISNIKDRTNGQRTYNAVQGDTMIYGTIKNKLGNVVASCTRERAVQNCKSTCSGRNGDDLLGCAENYCQLNSNNADEKKDCITTCGYTAPSFSSCSSATNTNGVDTQCSASTTAETNNCTVANTNQYVKTICTETSTIKYGDSLPVELLPGTGFSYTPILSGNKTCEITFEANKWKFDYAAAYTDAERNRLLTILKNFQTVGDESIWAKDVNDIYGYHSDDADIDIDVSNGSSTTTKKLEAYKTINLLTKNIVVTSGGSTRIPLYQNGARSYQTIFGLIKTTSSNQTAYRLPGVCVGGGIGNVYDVDENGRCNSSNDGPYYEYFTDLRLTEGTYPTKVEVSKINQANITYLDVDNTCRYSAEKDNLETLSCVIVYEDGTYRLAINNKYGVTIQYGISNEKNTINNLLEYVSTNSNEKIYGTIKKGSQIVATCESNKQNKTSTCVTEFKASEYDKIADYCRENWMEDTALYSSEKDCFNSCSTGRNTCKHNVEFSCKELNKVEDYCISNYMVDGYSSVASCINDCGCIENDKDKEEDGDCIGVLCNYVYRPVSLLDPFPNNRRPGFNWYGKEIYITDDLQNPVLNNGVSAEYVIELTPNRMSEIKGNTRVYNATTGNNAYIDYVYKNEYQTSGKYESKFIHINDIGEGGFYSYFTIINGTGV